ncbi:hypothetical protein OJ253_3505 [Cryptosporidium canis]|uniref:Uncharacterized protein n=1 Tax=Cryptosporidium canis TaxID=195482 RepID=A0A9D5DIK6_9CRYT|nr:hypothetical protein OJ253_3505 [Cryptosporidium canis]
MLGSRKYRRWVNNQLLINRGRAFQIHQYCDSYEFDEIESIIISSSFRDPNYIITPSIWIKLSSDDELHKLFLDCKEDRGRLGKFMVSSAEIGAPNRDLFARIKKICSSLNIDEMHLVNCEGGVERIHREILTSIHLRNCVTGYLGKIFGEVLSLLDRDDLIEFVFSMENLIVELIQNSLKSQQKLCEKTDKLVLVSDRDSKVANIYNVKDPSISNGPFLRSSEFKSFLSSTQRPNSLIVQGCNKLLRKVIHCLSSPYYLNSRSISLASKSKHSEGSERVMILSPCKSASSVALPKVRLSTLLKINQIYSDKQGILAP